MEELVPLLHPLVAARLHPEEVVEKVFRRGVFVQPAHQIGDGAVKILGLDHRRVEEQTARLLLDRAGLVVRHPFQHLEIDKFLHPRPPAQEQAIGHIEQIVAGDADAHGPRPLRVAAVGHHPFEVGVHFGFVGVGGQGPVVERGLHPFHRQIRPLHNAYFDGRAAPLHPAQRPFGQLLHLVEAVGNVGLQHNPRGEGHKFRLVQYFFEGVEGQVQVPVLLHIQIDEFVAVPAVRVGVAVGHCLAVEGAQPFLHQFDGVAVGGQIDLTEDGGDFDGDVFHIGPGQQGQVSGHTSGRLLLAQNRLAQLVEIEAHAAFPPPLQIAAQVALLAGEDDRAGLLAQPGDNRRHDNRGQIVAHHPADGERGPLPPVHIVGCAVFVQQVGNLVGDARGLVAAKGLVNHRNRQLFAQGIVHQPGQPLGLFPFPAGLLAAGAGEQFFSQGYGFVCEFARGQFKGSERHRCRSFAGK